MQFCNDFLGSFRSHFAPSILVPFGLPRPHFFLSVSLLQFFSKSTQIQDHEGPIPDHVQVAIVGNLLVLQIEAAEVRFVFRHKF